MENSILYVLNCLGIRVTLSADAAHLIAAPKSALTESIREILRRHKASLVAALAEFDGIARPDHDDAILESVALKLSPSEAACRVQRCLARFADSENSVWIRAASDFAIVLEKHCEWMAFGVPPLPKERV